MKGFRNPVFKIKDNGLSLINPASLVKDFNYADAKFAKGKAPVQNVTQSNAPWGPQQGFLTRGHELANRILNRTNGTFSDQPETFFPGQTYASFSPQTEQALNLTEQRALAGNPIQNAMSDELAKTLRGEYLYGGPGFNAAFEAARNKIIPQVQSRFAKAGRTGSGLSRVAETQALADAFASQYGNERNNQLRALAFAPQGIEASYNDLQKLASVGAAREGQAQSAIDEAIARHDFQQNLDAQKLAQYMGIISGQLGTEGFQSTTGFKGNRGSGLLGGALGGGYLGGQLGGPWGAAGGAGIGALLSLFQ